MYKRVDCSSSHSLARLLIELSRWGGRSHVCDQLYRECIRYGDALKSAIRNATRAWQTWLSHIGPTPRTRLVSDNRPIHLCPNSQSALLLANELTLSVRKHIRLTHFCRGMRNIERNSSLTNMEKPPGLALLAASKMLPALMQPKSWAAGAILRNTFSVSASGIAVKARLCIERKPHGTS